MLLRMLLRLLVVGRGHVLRRRWLHRRLGWVRGGEAVGRRPAEVHAGRGALHKLLLLKLLLMMMLELLLVLLLLELVVLRAWRRRALMVPIVERLPLKLLMRRLRLGRRRRRPLRRRLGGRRLLRSRRRGRGDHAPEEGGGVALGRADLLLYRGVHDCR